ncbi:hypothetical protein II906_01020, partial [bacterium]|nr:hypothetical protein [bacterium]
FIERMASRYVTQTKDGIFLDCCLCYEGSPISNLSGLDHLENEKINVLADGDLQEGLIVHNGSVSLKSPASKIIAGIPYEFELETLNLEGDNTFGIDKIVNEIDIFVDKSREDFYIVGSGGELALNSRSINSINDANYLFSGNVKTSPFADYSDSATVHIKQPYPFPITVNAISMDISMADTNA